jgi:hypothetical protein
MATAAVVAAVVAASSVVAGFAGIDVSFTETILISPKTDTTAPVSATGADDDSDGDDDDEVKPLRDWAFLDT